MWCLRVDCAESNYILVVRGVVGAVVVGPVVVGSVVGDVTQSPLHLISIRSDTETQ